MLKEAKAFLTITFLISIVFFGISIILSQTSVLNYGELFFMLIYGIACYAPAMAGIIAKKIYYTKSEFKDFLTSIINPRLKIKWYIFILVSLFIVWSSPIIIFINNITEYSLLKKPIYSLLWLIPIMIIGGGVEEIGWRGLLFPELRKKYSFCMSAISIGVIWAIWHIPMWFVINSPQTKINFLLFTLSCITVSFLLAFIYEKTASIFLCIFMHAVQNAYYYLFTTSIDYNFITITFALFIAILIYTISDRVIFKVNYQFKDDSVL